MEQKKRFENYAYSLSKKLNALNNKSRLALMGLLYIEKKKNFSEIADETNMDSNNLAYHLNILLDTELIQRKNGEYHLTRTGKKFLKDIGFINKIQKIKIEERTLPSLITSVSTNPPFYYNQYHQLLQSPIISEYRMQACLEMYKRYAQEEEPVRRELKYLVSISQQNGFKEENKKTKPYKTVNIFDREDMIIQRQRMPIPRSTY